MGIGTAQVAELCKRHAFAFGVVFGLVVIGSACGGGGSSTSSESVPTSGSPSAAGPVAPASLSMTTANGNVLVMWSEVPSADQFRIYWSDSPSIDPTGKSYTEVSSSPYQISDVTGNTAVYCVVTSVNSDGEGLPSIEQSTMVAPSSPIKYYPTWYDVVPTTEFVFNYNSGQTSAQNGAALKSVISNLMAGDRLTIGTGTYTIDSLFDISLVGTASNPIWIVAASGATPVITRSNASQNTVNMGSGGPCSYVCMRGIEITGGSIALRMYDCDNVWIDKCHIHDCEDNAIAANSVPVNNLTFTENEIHGTGGTGEGFYIGGNFASPIAHSCVIAMNHVYNTAGSQGDGIEVKQGSWGNWIAENIVHDTPYPSILVYGTGGMAPNLIERNICWNSGDNVMQVQGEAIVRNNLLMNGKYGFYSSDHQGTVTDLVVVHNTIINTSFAARMNDWNNKPGMIFANNACYSQNAAAMLFNDGSTGATISGNVVLGSVSGASSGFVSGVGISDFANASFNAALRDVRPNPTGALIDAGTESLTTMDDLYGDIRTAPIDVGAVDG